MVSCDPQDDCLTSVQGCRFAHSTHQKKGVWLLCCFLFFDNSLNCAISEMYVHKPPYLRLNLTSTTTCCFQGLLHFWHLKCQKWSPPHTVKGPICKITRNRILTLWDGGWSDADAVIPKHQYWTSWEWGWKLLKETEYSIQKDFLLEYKYVTSQLPWPK